MGKINLGRVRGNDGGFGNVRSVYLNDGGLPGVSVEMRGPDTAKDVDFTFSNLVNDPMTGREIEQLVAGEVVQSSNVVNGSVMTQIWAAIKRLFAPKGHEHDAADIESGEFGAERIKSGAVTEAKLADDAVTADKLADGSVGIDHLDIEMREDWESLSQLHVENRGGWTVATFHGGVRMAWAPTKVVARAASTAWGSAYYTECYPLSLPAVLSSVDFAAITARSSNLAVHCGCKQVSVDTITPYVLTHTPLTVGSEFGVFCLVIGVSS